MAAHSAVKLIAVPALVGAAVSVGAVTASGSTAVNGHQVQCGAGDAVRETVFDYAAVANGAATPPAALNTYLRQSQSTTAASAYSQSAVAADQLSTAAGVRFTRTVAGRTVDVVEVDPAGTGWVAVGAESCAPVSAGSAK
jgi:hypothetical protein